MDRTWHYNTYLEKQCGAMVFVDEYGTAFWSKLDYVLLSPGHPIFMAKRTYGALKELHQERADHLEWAGKDKVMMHVWSLKRSSRLSPNPYPLDCPLK
jgi:hypothetical protein